MERVHLIIYGSVQGVFYRASTKQAAQRLGLSGWVRNNSDGTVEVMADGEKEVLLKLVEFCKQGPKAAKIEKVDVEWLKPEHEFTQFVLY